ncbi:ABC transporter ATP-binding protein [Candidatus Kaiserbacteria bacterium]|nr:ABC transporter ATP-binding protein [Candidatus Kaiserbacteria bacterium]
MASPLINIDHLNFYFDYGQPSQLHALKDINLEVTTGEYVVFFGPSGCGKTTLIYLIGGISANKGVTGSIHINGSDVLELPHPELAQFRQTGIGIIFQNFNLIPSLSVLDNVALPMTFIGVPLGERREAARKLLARLSMEEYARRYPSELSGGQQQRVGIARALANNPPLIIADEPIGNLDSENAEHVLTFLKELQEKDGRTIIMVTHEAWSVRDADKIVYLKDGVIVKTSVGTEEKIAAQASSVPLSPDLFKKLYPELTQEEIMVKSLSNMILRGFSADEIKRFEQYLAQRLSGEIDAAAFEANLDLPYHKGGVGLWRQRARRVAAMTERILAEKTKLADIYAELSKNPEMPINEEVRSLREWLLMEYHGQVDDQLCARLDEATGNRLRNRITSEEFRTRASLARAHGGMGLTLHTAQHMSDRLDAVLAWSQAGTMRDAIAMISNS